MIIGKVYGGLGNQMFQYAIAKQVALRNGDTLKIDKFFFEDSKGTVRFYELDCFNLTEGFASREEVEKLANPRGTMRPSKHVLKRFLNRLKSGVKHKKTHYYESRNFVFDKRLMNIQGDCYLEGFFQTEKYFSEFAETIKKDFSFKEEPLGQSKILAEEIKNSNSVSIHVRRTDLVRRKDYNKFLGVCSVEYYEKAIDSILKKFDDARFFVFSDDIEWAKENLNTVENITFVSHNDSKNGVEDLRLMSLCKHNIIANSTFSWWGAWLNNNNNKVVYAPSLWAKSKSYSTDFVVPEKWHKI